MSATLGVSRSQNPAKWLYDLILSKRVPVVGIMNATKAENFSQTKIDIQIMGTFGPKGDVIKGTGYRQGLGVVPVERGGAPANLEQ